MAEVDILTGRGDDRLVAEESSVSSPFPRKTMETLAINTSYYEAGRGRSRPLLLLHGMSSSGDSFRELMLELGHEIWMIAPDIPGFGYSDDTSPYIFPHLVEWLASFISGLGVRPVHLAGHSFGGALAVTFALAYPDDVTDLTLLAPSVLRPGKYPEWLRSFSKSSVAEKVLEVGVTASRVLIQRQIRSAFYDPSRFDGTLWQRRLRDYELARASAAVLRASAMHDVRSSLDQLQQPSCLVWGKQDPVLDPHDAQRLSDLMPASTTRLHMLEECGHVPQIEQQAEVVKIVRGFIKSDGAAAI
jgi:pimeloyl-ACP methyl ester carboxylesterase